MLNPELLDNLGFLNLPEWAEGMVEILQRDRHASILSAPVLQDNLPHSEGPWRFLAEPDFVRRVKVGWHFADAATPSWWPDWIITADSDLAVRRWLREGNPATGVRAAIGGTSPLVDLCRDGILLSPPQRLLALPDGVATFVCSALEQERVNLSEALREAQWQGAAPANAGRHLHSLVARDRLGLLASALFGIRFDIEKIGVEGFGKLERLDVVIAQRLGFALRQLGVAERHSDGRFEIWVQPRLIPSRYLLSQVRGGLEAAYLKLVDGTPKFYMGAGTGKTSTLRGMMRDLVEFGAQRHAKPVPIEQVEIIPTHELNSAFYLRLGIMSFARTLAGVTTIFADHGIGLRTVLPANQLSLGEELTHDETSDLILMTERVNEGSMTTALEQIKNEVKLAGLRCVLRLEGEALPAWS